MTMNATRLSGLRTQGIIAGLLLCLTHNTFAQDQLSNSATDFVEGITVHGHSEMKVKPDIAFANLSVTTQAKAESDAVSQNATRAAALLSQLKQAGVAATDIQTQFYTVQPQYDYTASPAVLTGYEVVNSFRVKLVNLPKAGLILDEASAAGATQTEGLTFDLLDRKKVQAEALVAAVADAREKADLMAGAAGVGVGRLRSLTDQPNLVESGPRPMFAMRAAVNGTATTPVSPQAIDITEDVTAVYAITSAR